MRTNDPEERKRELLSIALELFLEVGYEKLNVNEIAKKAGVTKGLLYYYFRSKEEMLIESSKQEVKKIVGILSSLSQPGSTPPLDSLRLLIQAVHKYFQENFELAVRIHKPENTFLHDAMTMKSIEYLTPLVAGIIKRGNEAGVFKCDFPERTAAALVYGITESVHTRPANINDKAYLINQVKEQQSFLVSFTTRLLGLKEEDAIKIFQ